MTRTPQSADNQVIRSVVMAPGVELDEATTHALTELRDQQEARLVAYNHTQTAVRRAIKASRPPTLPPENPDRRSAVDTSGQFAHVEWPTLPILGEWQSITRAATGEFVPVSTDLRQEYFCKAENMSDGTHFWGNNNYDGDDIIHFSVGATSHFELRPENLPESATGRYHSAPPGDAYGIVHGWHATYNPIYAADDKRCRCWRVFRHALWQRVNNQWHMLGEKYSNETLFNAENELGGYSNVFRLSGFMPSPEFDFGLVDRNVSVWAQVEIRFDIELEGESFINFGASAAAGVVVRTFGWWARPL